MTEINQQAAVYLSSGQLYPVATGLQFEEQGVAMVTLDFNDAVPDRTAAPAAFFQRSGQFLE